MHAQKHDAKNTLHAIKGRYVATSYITPKKIKTQNKLEN